MLANFVFDKCDQLRTPKTALVNFTIKYENLNDKLFDSKLANLGK